MTAAAVLGVLLIAFALIAAAVAQLVHHHRNGPRHTPRATRGRSRLTQHARKRKP